KIQKRLLTIKEASEYLGISEKGLYNMVWRKEIPFVKIRKRVRFDIEDIKEWIERNKIKDIESEFQKVLDKI
ncbi:MAG TPA: helix-turn-helix domain-containing protein, partial [bacterium]|nr:helix-turn-helix domain-containing protein [bacterium]